MLKRHALIRKLPAVETLGSVSVICTDKTGTLTENSMTVTVIDVANHQLQLNPRTGTRPSELIAEKGESVDEAVQPTLELLMVAGALCNDAVLHKAEGIPKTFRAIGDPTENALVLAAARFGTLKETLEQSLPRTAEVPFDSERKRMTTVHRVPPPPAAIPVSLREVLGQRAGGTAAPSYVAFTKGALNSVLEISREVWVEGRCQPLDDTWRERIAAAHDNLAAKGTRVLAVALRPLDAIPSDGEQHEVERDLIFLGMFGMLDPPRAEVKDAVAACRAAGIRPVMITGDHPLTAQHIASQVGIGDNERFLTGQELERLSADELRTAVAEVSVFARVAPEHKLRLIAALQAQGHIVSMTGDGVNDAPALKKADIGVAMGITGTDVAKEASDMILVDDNFATIVAAVEEGRVIYDNVRKFIKYLLSCNASEVLVMFIGPLLGMPLPLLPLQILWMNLVTDGLPALALGRRAGRRGCHASPAPLVPREHFWTRNGLVHPDRRRDSQPGLTERRGVPLSRQWRGLEAVRQRCRELADFPVHDPGLLPDGPGALRPFRIKSAVSHQAAFQSVLVAGLAGDGRVAIGGGLRAALADTVPHPAAVSVGTGRGVWHHGGCLRRRRSLLEKLLAKLR